jgi:hypothetical protein
MALPSRQCDPNRHASRLHGRLLRRVQRDFLPAQRDLAIGECEKRLRALLPIAYARRQHLACAAVEPMRLRVGVARPCAGPFPVAAISTGNKIVFRE